MCFVSHSAGSVVVEYTVTMDKATNVNDLTVAIKQGVSKLNFSVDLASVSFTGQSSISTFNTAYNIMKPLKKH